MLAVAIENERDEEVNDGALPQMPAGFVVRLPIRDGQADCANLQRIELTGQGLAWTIDASSPSLGGVTGAYTPQSATGSVDRILGQRGICIV